MTAPWKLAAEARLMNADTPAVLTTAMVQMIATGGLDAPPSRPTFQRWMNELAQTGKLRRVIKGVYINRLGHRDASPAAAAHWVRARSVVSLSWVLEQAGLTNNFGDTVTCVIPTDPTWPQPQISDRQTDAGMFRFFAMPAHLVDERAGGLADIRDLRFDYPRTTPEKALLDWVYLGASAHSRLTRPPLDLDTQPLNQTRLKRLVTRMGMQRQWTDWQDQRASYQADPDVRDNAASWLRI